MRRSCCLVFLFYALFKSTRALCPNVATRTRGGRSCLVDNKINDPPIYASVRPVTSTSRSQRRSRVAVGARGALSSCTGHYLSRPRLLATASLVALRGGATAVSTPPPLRVWALPALCCATAYALYNLFIKKASSSIDPILGGVLLQFVAALMGTGLLIVKQIAASSGSSTTAAMKLTKMGVAWSVGAGIMVGAAELLSFFISGTGAPATQSIPIIVGGSIVVGTVLGSLWLQERLTVVGWVGVLLIAAGIVLVGINPGGTLGH